MPFVSVTRLRVRSWWYLPAFIIEAIRSSRQAKAAAGVLGVKVLRDAHNTWWTCTAWESEASMRGFMLANPHRPAMLKLKVWCDEASVIHWTQPTDDLPSWPEAHRRMLAEGRPSKVNRPSPAHTAHQPAPPRVRPGAEVVFK